MIQILSFRYNDTTDGSYIVDEVLQNYKAAWAKKGMIGENGLFHRNYYPNQGTYGVAQDVGQTAWYVFLELSQNDILLPLEVY